MLDLSVRHAFPGFTLDVRIQAPAGITVLFGRSGSGKTSLINAVAGLLRPTEGRIRIDDWTLLDTEHSIDLPPHRRRLGYIFQDARLFPHMNVRRNLEYGGRFAPGNAPRESLDRVVGLLGIGHLLDRRPGGLSGGERQRVAVGRALLSAPKLILADEPLAALDEARKAEILPYFERLRDELEIPILYVSHSAAEVARLATTVVELEGGRVVARGDPGRFAGATSTDPPGPETTVLEARVIGQRADGQLDVVANGSPLRLPGMRTRPGATVQLRIAARDVLLTTGDPGASSAWGHWPATVRDVRVDGGKTARVVVDTAIGCLLAEVDAATVNALPLQPGSSVHALVRTVAVMTTSPRTGSSGSMQPTGPAPSGR